jgi:hypothetical protein
MTYFLQPLDVSVNSSFKSALRAAWSDWFENTPPEYTPKGYRKRPSYQALINFVDKAIQKISPEIIKRSFECCGIGEFGTDIPREKMNSKICDVLSFADRTTQVTGTSGPSHHLQTTNESDEASDEDTNKQELVSNDNPDDSVDSLQSCDSDDLSD